MSREIAEKRRYERETLQLYHEQFHERAAGLIGEAEHAAVNNPQNVPDLDAILALLRRKLGEITHSG